MTSLKPFGKALTFLSQIINLGKTVLDVELNKKTFMPFAPTIEIKVA
jgi:hypothetical protein